MAKLDHVIIDLLESTAKNLKATPLNLGGIHGAGGGRGGPPGGFIGWLPQTRVAYDEDELESPFTSASGSLLDNLNHIRYRLGTLESGASITVIDSNTASIFYDVDTIHFSGAGVIVTDLGDGDVKVEITATGSGGSGTPLTVQEIDGSPIVTNVDKIIFSGAIVTDLGSGDALVTIPPLTLKDHYNSTIVIGVDQIEFSGAVFDVIDMGSGDTLVDFKMGEAITRLQSVGSVLNDDEFALSRGGGNGYKTTYSGLKSGMITEAQTLPDGNRVVLKDPGGQLTTDPALEWNPSTNSVEFGADVGGKETNAGKIGYQAFSGDSLDIVGAGASAGSRKVTLYDDLFTGNIDIGSGKVYKIDGSTVVTDVMTGVTGGDSHTHSYFGNAIYGDATDGDATLDGVNTYVWASLSGTTYTLLRDVYLGDLTINSGKTLLPAGFRIFGTGTLDNAGTIHNNGNNGSADSGGSSTALGWFSQGSQGGAGVASGAAAGPGVAGGMPTAGTVTGGLGGRGAGAWGSTTRIGRSGGTLSTAFPTAINGGSRIIRSIISVLDKLPVGGQLLLGAAAGGGGGAKSTVGTSCNSGGGGGGAGIIAIVFATIINSGTISANGGNGGNAGGTAANAGGGGGGGGGTIIIVYNDLTDTGTISADGGSGGTSVALGTTPLRGIANSVTVGSSTTLSNSALTVTAPTSGTFGSKNTLYIAYAHQSGGTLNTPTLTGWGLTWNVITTVDFNSIATPTRRLCAWYAYGTPTLLDDKKDVVFQYSSAPTTANAAITEIQNAPATIVQSATNRVDSATTLTVTLGSAFGSTDAMAFAIFGFSAGSARVAGAGFTIVDDFTAPQMTSEVSYNDTTDNISWTTAAACGGIALEIAAIGTMESGQAGYPGNIVYLH
jgi:hypothetical protein